LVRFRLGKKRLNSDALSRAPFAWKEVTHSASALVAQSIKDVKECLVTLSKNDTPGSLRALIKTKQNDDLFSQQMKKQALSSEPGDFDIDSDGVLVLKQGRRVVIPDTLRTHLLETFHDSLMGGHFGRDRTYDALKRCCFWPNMLKDVESWIKHCPVCQRFKGKPLSPQPALRKNVLGSYPFEVLAIDVIGPLTQSLRGNKFILTMVDTLTRWPEVRAFAKDPTAQDVADALIECIVARHGAPSTILSDRGKQFISEVFKEVNNQLGIHQLFTTPYRPQTNGLCERFNRTIKGYLKRYSSSSGTDWEEYLPWALFCCRSQVHQSTGLSPFFCLFGRDMPSPAFLKREEQFESLGELSDVVRKRLQVAHFMASFKSHEKSSKARELFDTRRNIKENELNVGDKVLLKNNNRKNLADKAWKGPFIIKEILEEENDKPALLYRLIKAGGSDKPFVARSDRIKIYHDGQDATDSDVAFTPRLSPNEAEVEEIKGVKVVNGVKFYEVKWADKDNRSNQWLQEDQIDAPLAIAKFERNEMIKKRFSSSFLPTSSPLSPSSTHNVSKQRFHAPFKRRRVFLDPLETLQLSLGRIIDSIEADEESTIPSRFKTEIRLLLHGTGIRDPTLLHETWRLIKKVSDKRVIVEELKTLLTRLKMSRTQESS